MPSRVRKPRRFRREAIWGLTLGAGLCGATLSMGSLPTTIRDFFFGGTQPLTLVDLIESVNGCSGCHGNFNLNTEPYRPWAASMMGQAARDPVFHAALAIANQDADFAGEFCLRCHTPGGWIGGRSEPTNGSALFGADFEGVNCNFCHRMVDPVFQPGNPSPDVGILAGLPNPPNGAHSANYIVDPYDRRRGPHDLGPEFPYHEWLKAPFQGTSNMCATCHDVSNPVYTRQVDGTYALNALNTPHPDGDKHNMFPLERTFGEWSRSAYAAGPVNVNGRFGGDLEAVSSCQDCHMPVTSGQSCRWTDPRDKLRLHQFNGGNTWVLRAVRNLYPDYETGLTDTSVSQSIARTLEMLAKASDLEATIVPVKGVNKLKVRITNWGGHKLPTGYAEGRRMWINVRFLNSGGVVLQERGAYNSETAVLDSASTKVYEAKMGLDEAVAAATGRPAGPGFHFVLNNKWFKDNRIPPPGFTNAGFAEVQASPVGYSYADGQHWDDTLFDIPSGTSSVRVSLYYQTSSKEYMDFLRSANTTNNAGEVAYDQWLITGKSEPALMGNKFAAGDPYANCDGSTGTPQLTANDFQCFLNKFAGGC